MGATSSKQGRYVVNPDPTNSDPVNPDTNTPSKARRYRPIRSPVELNLNDNNECNRSQMAASLRFNTYPDDSARREEFYTPARTPDPDHTPLDSEFFTPSVKGGSPSAETLQCTDPLRRGDYLGKSNHPHADQIVDNVCVTGNHESVNIHAHNEHMRGNSDSQGPHMGNTLHANGIHVGSNANILRDQRVDNNNSHGPHPADNVRANGHHVGGDVHIPGNHTVGNNNSHGPHMGDNHANGDQIGSYVHSLGGNIYTHGVYIGNKPHPNRDQMGTLNGHGHYVSRNDHTTGHHMGGSVVQQKEDGRTVTHFLPYTTSTPRNQGFESTSLFVPYITSTPHKQYQIVPQTPPDVTIPPAPDQEEAAMEPSSEPMVPGSFTILDALFLISSMVMYIVDIVMDILVAVQYFRTDHTLWSGMTMAFIIIPSITLQYFSLRWHFADSLQAADKQKESGNLKSRVKVTLCTIMTWMITHTLQLGAINRYWRTLKFGWRSRSGETAVKDYNHMVCEYRDTTMLRLLEAFMESAPQLVLQLYIMTQMTEIHWLTAASALSSLASLSWCLEAYHKALRESDSSVKNIGWFGLSFRMTAKTFLITSRVISLALFAAYFEWWVFVVAGAHWLLMTLWLICQKTKFCGTPCEEVMFDAIIGIVHIFCFFNMKPGRTRYRALGYYTLAFVENTIMFALWYTTIGKDTTYGLPALVFVWGGFFLGITILLFYYRFLHPDGRMPLCDCKCLQKNSADAAEERTSHPEGAVTVTDGVALSHLRQSNKKKNKRVEGNMFSWTGRRHLYWVRPSSYPASKVDNMPRTQPDVVGDIAQKPAGGHAFLETSLL